MTKDVITISDVNREFEKSARQAELTARETFDLANKVAKGQRLSDKELVTLLKNGLSIQKDKELNNGKGGSLWQAYTENYQKHMDDQDSPTQPDRRLYNPLIAGAEATLRQFTGFTL
jgi:hypothetical protein